MGNHQAARTDGTVNGSPAEERSMIVGLGIDIAEMARLAKVYEKFGRRFLEKFLTPTELASLPAQPLPYIAGRFAAKEAAVKALGTGFAEGIGPRDVAVRSLPSGKPELVLSGKAREKADALGAKKLHLTLTHTRDNAAAVVILEG